MQLSSALEKLNPFSKREVRSTCPVCGEATDLLLTMVQNGKERVLCDGPAQCRCDREKAARRSPRMPKKVDALNRSLRGDFAKADGRNAAAMDVCLRYAKRFAEASREQVNGLLLYGDTRQGKTFAAEAVSQALAADGWRVTFRSVTELMQTYDADGFSERTYLSKAIKKCDLFVLDDLGAERNTTYAQEVIFGAIDARTTSGAPLLITTNLTPDSMAKRAGTDLMTRRLYGRILEACLPVEFEHVRESTERDYEAMLDVLYGASDREK